MAIENVIQIPGTIAPGRSDWQTRRLYIRFRYTGGYSNFKLEIFSIALQRIRSITFSCSGGQAVCWWHGETDSGDPCSGGVYVYKISVGSSKHQGKIMVLR